MMKRLAHCWRSPCSRAACRLQHDRRAPARTSRPPAGHREGRRKVQALLDDRHGTLSHRHRARRAARPRQRRHRRDHPEAVPEVDQAHRASARTCSTRGATSTTASRAWTTRTRPLNPDFVLNQPRYQGAQILLARAQLRLRQLARARAVGARRLRLPRDHRAVVTPTSSSTTASRTACCRSCCRSRRSTGCSTRSQAFPGFKLTIDLERQTVRDAGRRADVRLRHRAVPQALPAQRPRRHRPHAAARRRDPRVRGEAASRAALAATCYSELSGVQPHRRARFARTMKIAILPGDGIGPEIVAAGRQACCDALRARRPDDRDRDGADRRRRLRRGAAIRCPTRRWRSRAPPTPSCCGAVGGPQYDTLPRAAAARSRGCCGIRKALGLFANLRPALLYPELAAASTLKPEVVAGLDIMIIRELTGDIYFGQPRGRRTNAAGEREGFDTMLYSEPEIRRIARVGFETARKRGSKLCSVDKANVLDTSILWREVVTAMAKRLSRRRALAHVRRQRRDAAGAQPEAVRRDRHRQHVRRHPVRRGVDARPARSACCRRPRSTRAARACTSRSTARRPTSPGKDMANPLATILSAGDDAPLHVRAGGDGADAHRARGASGAGAGLAHRRTSRAPGDARSSARGKWATRSSRRCRPPDDVC